MGLSTAEKVRILDQIIETGFDRTRALKIISDERKLRSDFYFAYLNSSIGGKE